MAGNVIARAVVEVLGDAGDLSRRLTAQLRTAFKGIEVAAEASATASEQAFADIGLEIQRHIAIAASGFESLGAAGQETAGDIRAEYRDLAADINRTLAIVGETAFEDLPEDARRAIAQTELLLRRFVTTSNASLETLGETAFEDLPEEFRPAAEKIQLLLRRIQSVGNFALENIENGEFAELAGLALVATSSIAEALVTMGEAGEHAIRQLGGDSFLEFAREGDAAVRSLVQSFLAAGPVIEQSIDLTDQFAEIAAEAHVAARSMALSFAAASNDIEKKNFGFLQRAKQNIAQAVVVSGVFAAGALAVGFLAAGIIITAELERIELGIQNIVAAQQDISFEQAGEQARELLFDLREVALATPFAFKGLAANVQQLLATGRQLEGVLADVNALGGIAAVVGADPDSLTFVIRALGQIGSSTKVYQQDLNQIIQRLPGFNARQQLAAQITEQFGVTMGQANDAIREGSIETEEFGRVAINGQNAVSLLLKAMEEFPGAQEALGIFAQSITGQLERLKESAQFALQEGFEPLAEFLSGGVPGLRDPKKGFIGQLAETVRVAVADIGIGLTTAFQALGPRLLDLFREIGKGLGVAFAAIGEEAGSLLASLQPGFEVFTDFFVDNADRITDVLVDLGEILGEFASSGFEVLAVGLEIALPLLQAALFVLEAIPEPLRNMLIALILLRSPIAQLAKLFTLLKFGAFLTGTIATTQGLSSFTVAATAARTAVAGLAASLAPLLVPIAVTAGLFLAVNAFASAREKAAEYRREVEQLEQAFEGVIDGQADFNEVLQDFVKERLAEASVEINEALGKIGVTIKEIAEAIADGESSLAPLTEELAALGVEIEDLGRLSNLAGSLVDPDAREDLNAIAEALGLSARKASELIGRLGELDDQAQASAQAILGLAVLDGVLTQAMVDAALEGENWAGALKELRPTIDAAAEAAARSVPLIAQVADGTVLAADAFDMLQVALDEITQVTTLSRAETAGLTDEVEALASMIIGGGIQSVEELMEALADLGVSSFDTGLALEAATERVVQMIEEANTALDRLDPSGAISAIDEFAEGLKSQFTTAGSALDAFTTNYEAFLDNLIAETLNVDTILNAGLTGPIGQFLTGLVTQIQGTGPDAAALIADIAAIIGDPEALKAEFGAIRDRFTMLGIDLRVDLLSAFEAGEVGFAELLAPDLLKVEAQAAATAENVKRSVGEIVASITEGTLRQRQLLAEDIAGAQGGPTTAAAVVQEVLGDPVAPAQQAGLDAAGAFTDTFSAGISAASPELSSVIVGTVSDAMSSANLLLQIAFLASAAFLAAEFGAGLAAGLIPAITTAGFVATGVVALQFIGIGSLLRGLGVFAGFQFGLGVASGIQSSAFLIRAAAVAAIQTVINAVNALLGIKSPSKVGIVIGERFGQGMSLGIDHLRASVAQSARSLAEAAVVNGVSATPLGARGGQAGGVQVVTEPKQSFFEGATITAPGGDPELWGKIFGARAARNVRVGGFKR